jgi:hypothetical protein
MSADAEKLTSHDWKSTEYSDRISVLTYHLTFSFLPVGKYSRTETLVTGENLEKRFIWLLGRRKCMGNCDSWEINKQCLNNML